jgi:pimeloyl-ACP methyl ester carboxylesterase
MVTRPPAARHEREIGLLLPAMALNATVFPVLEFPTIAVDFTELTLGRGGAAAAHEGMELYRRLLDGCLESVAEWAGARRIVVAYSFGGMLALHWLLAHRCQGVARIDGLVLVATTAGPLFDVVRLRIGRFRGREVRLPVKYLMPLWNTRLVTCAVKSALTKGSLAPRRVDFRTRRGRSDLAIDLAGWRNTGWRAMRSYRYAMRRFDVRAALGGIGVRTIVLHGTEDLLFPTSAAEDLAWRLPEADLRLVQGAGHGLPLTHGDEVRRAVGDLTSHAPTARL